MPGNDVEEVSCDDVTIRNKKVAYRKDDPRRNYGTVNHRLVLLTDVNKRNCDTELIQGLAAEGERAQSADHKQLRKYGAEVNREQLM